MDKKKVLVIGLDGVSFRLINPWLENNLLPTLRSLMEDGCWAEMESVYPPLTPAAWSSFYTGKNPGKHGLFDYLYRKQDSYQMLPSNSTKVEGDSLWKIISRNGKKVGIINVPMTYPATQVNGIMLSGLFTPNLDDLNKTDFTYPPELKTEIKENIGQYRIHPRFFYTKGNIKELMNDYYDLIEQRFKTASYFMKSKPWDFMMVVINETDHIQHQLWHLLDRNHPNHDPTEAEKNKDVFLKLYQKVDSGISQLLNLIDPDTTHVIVMSDHGLGPVYKWINLNSWLLRKGYISIKSNPLSLLRHFAFRLGFTPANVYKLMLYLKRKKKAEKKDVASKKQILSRFFLNETDIDWEKTKAYSIGHMGQININLKGRDPQGKIEPKDFDMLIEQLKEELKTIEDRHSNGNLKLIEDILRKEQLFHGPYLDRAADLYLKVSPQHYHVLGGATFISNKLIERSYGNTATHRTDGIFITSGPHVKKSSTLEKRVNIYDITANVLYMLGLPVPNDFDGKVTEGLYYPEHIKQNKIEYKKPEPAYLRQAKKAGMTEEEIAAASEMLKKLGYEPKLPH